MVTVCLVIFFFVFLFCDSPVLSNEPWNFEVSVKSELEDKECKTVSFFSTFNSTQFHKMLPANLCCDAVYIYY